ncbi:ACP S-malonyltransferase [Paenibacillus sp. SN-8-1]|uniref:ACP S-malonyltransferase n=1 Tax=Paenibacillus sp. SN-8-1 TaxID=3435409 RepID=UPI003D9AA41C
MKIALMFPGSGTQYAGMGQSWHEAYPIVRETFDEASERMGFSLYDVCTSETLQQDMDLVTAQAAIFVCSVAAYRVYMQEVGITPYLSAGHSLGEYAALVSAGAIRYIDALDLVCLRSRLMTETAVHGESGVVACRQLPIQITRREVMNWNRSYPDRPVDVACYNSQDQAVISGYKPDTEQLAAILEGLGGRAIPLSIQAPIHSRLLQGAVAPFREQLARLSIEMPKWPVISNVTAKPYTDAESIVTGLAMQLTQPVQWLNTARFMQRSGISHALELGPKSTLSTLTKRTARNIRTYALDKADDLPKIQALKYSSSDLLGKCLAHAVSCRNRCEDAAQYASEVAEPFHKLAELANAHAEHSERSLSEQDDELQTAIELLLQIMKGKKVPEDEQQRRLNRLCAEGCTAARSIDDLAKSY